MRKSQYVAHSAKTLRSLFGLAENKCGKSVVRRLRRYRKRNIPKYKNIYENRVAYGVNPDCSDFAEALTCIFAAIFLKQAIDKKIKAINVGDDAVAVEEKMQEYCKNMPIEDKIDDDSTQIES